MQAEIVMIGTELLIGQIQDTNATFMAQALAENGINLYQKTTVGDNRARIIAALDAALRRADVVLCSGGLGPTEDDITRECVAELLQRPLIYDAGLFAAICDRFRHIRFKITENNKKQAMLPQGAVVIENPHGTAPGILVEDDRGVVICMPGVPHELKPMMTERVIPYLRNRFGISSVLHARILKVCGMGESRVDSMIGDLITQGSNPTVGLLASPDAVRIRIMARADNVAAAEALIDPVDEMVRERLGEMVLGCEPDTLEQVVDRLLQGRGWTLGVLEDITGGAICQRLTASGSAMFRGGRVLPIPPAGAKKVEKSIDMARRFLLELSVDCVLAVQARPEERCSEAAFVSPEHAETWVIGSFGAVERNQSRTAIVALEQVRRILLGSPPIGS